MGDIGRTAAISAKSSATLESDRPPNAWARRASSPLPTLQSLKSYVGSWHFTFCCDAQNLPLLGGKLTFRIARPGATPAVEYCRESFILGLAASKQATQTLTQHG
jgi:hypothetical protein